MFWFSWLNEIEPETLCNNEFFCCKSSSNFAVPISSCSLISNTEKNKKKFPSQKINKIMLRFLDQSMFMKWCKNVKKKWWIMLSYWKYEMHVKKNGRKKYVMKKFEKFKLKKKLKKLFFNNQAAYFLFCQNSFFCSIFFAVM